MSPNGDPNGYKLASPLQQGSRTMPEPGDGVRGFCFSSEASVTPETGLPIRRHSRTRPHQSMHCTRAQ